MVLFLPGDFEQHSIAFHFTSLDYLNYQRKAPGCFSSTEKLSFLFVNIFVKPFIANMANSEHILVSGINVPSFARVYPRYFTAATCSSFITVCAVGHNFAFCLSSLPFHLLLLSLPVCLSVPAVFLCGCFSSDQWHQNKGSRSASIPPPLPHQLLIQKANACLVICACKLSSESVKRFNYVMCVV